MTRTDSAGRCELFVGGQIYAGWTELEIQRGLEQIAGQFSLVVTEKWPGQDEPRPVRPGLPCVVKLDGDPVVTGYVDEAGPGYDEKSTWFNVTGRDKTEDLVDCSAIWKTGQWKGKGLAAIARDLCAPFGIEVVVDPSAAKAAGETVPSFNIEEGETVFDCLERAARLMAVLLITDGLGRLLISLPGARRAVTGLMEGENIKRAQGTFSWAERYSDYTVKGQARGQAHGKGSAHDSAIDRYRPLIVLAEDQAHGPSATRRAEWEKTVRAGRGNRARITVQGWRQDGESGPLWEPGLRVYTHSPRIRAIGLELLIVSVSYKRNDQTGTTSELEVADPRAFDLLAGVSAGKLGHQARGKGVATGHGDARTGKHKKKKEEDWSWL